MNSGSWRITSPNLHAGNSLRARLVILGLFALFLVWEVITRSFGAYFANTRPDIAIRLRANNPIALVKLAQGKLDLDGATPVLFLRDEARRESYRDEARRESYVAKGLQGSSDAEFSSEPQPNPADGASPTDTDSQDNAQISSSAQAALLNDPLNARALSILGLLSLRASELGRTRTLMQAAARLSLHESVAVDWMMRASYEDGDYRSAMRYADVLIRTRHQNPELALRVLGRIAENPDGSAKLKELLAGNPPWREQFFTSLPASITDARSPLSILLSLKNTPKPPTAAELRPYLQFLIGHGFHELAYYTWLQFLPPERLSNAGYLFNGSFEFLPSGLPFDWTFSAKSGVTIQIADRFDSNEPALFLEFGPGRVEDLKVTQLVFLPPGNYHFLGTKQVDMFTPRGLQWRVTCGTKARLPVGESTTITGSRAWENFEFRFTVPESECPAQYVELVFDASSASERFVSGSIWYDDLRIVRESPSGP
jgi:hypothetical protein